MWRMMRTLIGIGNHGTVLALSFSPDGSQLASAGGTIDGKGELKLFEVASGRELLSLGHGDVVRSVTFSPTGKLLASGGKDSSVRVWDPTSGRELRTLMGHTGWVRSVAFSQDGRLLASGGEDSTVRLWDADSGRQLYKLQGHGRDTWGVAFNRNGSVLASGYFDGSIEFWDTASGRQLRELPSHANATDTLAFSQHGLWLAVGSSDGTVNLWSTATGVETRRLVGHLDSPTVVVGFGSDTNCLASLGREGTVRIWNAASGQLIRELPAHASAIAISPDGRWVASGGLDETVRLFDVTTGQEIRSLRGHLDRVNVLAFAPNGRWVASGSSDKTVRVWEAATGKELFTLYAPEKIFSLAFNSDSSFLAAGNLDRSIMVWETATGRAARTLTCQPIRKNNKYTAEAYGISFSSDGRWLAAAGRFDATIRRWDATTGSELPPLVNPLDRFVSTVAFTPDNHWLLSGGWDGTVRVWDLESENLAATLVSLSEAGDWLVVTPDGLFDGSPRAWRNVLWRFNNNTFDVAPVELFFNEYYYPGLLAEILAGKGPKAKVSIESKDRRQPVIQLSVASGQPTEKNETATRNVSLKVNLIEGPADKNHPKGSGVQDLRLFRNGSLVKVWRGDLKLDAQGKTTLEATIPIVAGENRLTAYAFNNDNIKSSDATLVVTGADSLKRQGTAYIVAVGINQYANADYNLNFAVADAQDVGEELRTQQAKLGKYSKIELVPLLDNDATKGNFLQALQRLAGLKTGPLPASAPAAFAKLQPAQPEDAVFVYFAGHGAALGPRFYLIPHDLGYAGKRTELDEAGSKLIQEHSISDLELELAFEKVDAGELVLIIDACNSGQALEAEEKRRGPMNSKGLAQLAYEKGMYILTAAQGYQAALEAKQLGHGLLTYALVEEGLKTAAADKDPKDGQVMIREWLNYATERVPQLQEAKMQEAEKTGRELTFLEGEDTRGDRRSRGLQRPRVFYRREPESQPPVIARIP